MFRTRFAPSPTGYLHIGGLRTALYAYMFAKKNNGKFVLRIEDTDTERFVEGAVEIIYRTMKESGLVYDEGPDVGGDYAPYIQSERKELYTKYAHELVEKGGAYYCFCTKERIARLHEDGAVKYDKKCLALPLDEAKKRIASGEPYVIRQNIPTTGKSCYTDLVFGEICVDFADLEDNILLKSDGMPTYNFANVVDDHLMGITHIIRGTEYLSSTPKYNLLYQSFGWEVPQYIHLQPIMKDATRKLSKRYGDASYEDFIKRGFLKDAIINYIALLGWSPRDNCREKFSLPELIEEFGLEGISKSASIFDELKLRWLNAQYIKEMSAEDFHAYALPYYDCGIRTPFDRSVASALLQSRIEAFGDIVNHLKFLDEFEGYDLGLFVHERQKCTHDTAIALLPPIIEVLKQSQMSELNDRLTALAAQQNVKLGQVMWALRIGVSGSKVTPGGASEMCALVGKDEALRRLEESLNRLTTK